MFKKRETVVQNIAYLGLMAAVNVIFVLLTALFPPLMFILIFVLPLASTVVTFFCKKRYYPIYFIVTIGLCLLVSFGIYIYDTFFYVIPSLITGFLFGILIEKKVPSIHVLTLTTIVQYSLTYLSFILLNKIVTNIDFFDTFLNMFGLQNFEFKEIFKHVFCFLIAGIQNLFSYIIIKFEIKKLGIEINLNDKPVITSLANIAFIILSIGMYFCYAPLVYIFMFVSIYYFIYELCELIRLNNKKYFVIIGAILLLSIFMFALLYSYPIKPLSIVILSIPFGLVNVLYFVNYCLTKKQNYIK